MSFKTDATGDWAPVSPGAVLDWDADLTDWMPTGDTINTATWSVPSGLTIVSQNETDTIAKVWLSGFLEGTTYDIYVVITTIGGRTERRDFRLVCAKRGRA